MISGPVFPIPIPIPVGLIPILIPIPIPIPVFCKFNDSYSNSDSIDITFYSNFDSNDINYDLKAESRVSYHVFLILA